MLRLDSSILVVASLAGSHLASPARLLFGELTGMVTGKPGRFCVAESAVERPVGERGLRERKVKMVKRFERI